MANEWWSAAPQVDPFEAALTMEGVDPKRAAIARSIYQQESSSGKNTTTSNAGAVGGMQIIPATFSRMADKGWDINDPLDNARAGVRYVSKLYDLAEGDPRLTAVGYYGGEGAIPKAKEGIAVSDPRNPNAPNTLQYGDQVAARIPQESGGAWWAAAPLVESSQEPPKTATVPERSTLSNLWEGITQGAGDLPAGVGQSAVHEGQRTLGYIDDLFGTNLAKRVQPEVAARDAEVAKREQDYQAATPGSFAAGVGRVGGNLVPMLAGGAASPVGRLSQLGSQAISAAPAAGRLLGATTAGALEGAAYGASAPVANVSAVPGGVGDLVTGRMTGDDYRSKSLGNAALGAAIGGAAPPVLGAISKAGSLAGALLKPFSESGQKGLAGAALRDFATDPKMAAINLRSAAEVIPGSAPTTAMASGDTGLAALSRAMQNADPRYAAELAARQTAQNQARTAAMEAVAANPGKLATAKAARDALTNPLRESVLDAAGSIPAEPILKSIDRLIKQPDNAGKLSQQALNEFRSRIGQFSPEGAIDARALYAIRKDINDVLGGKLQGEAGNIRYASSQLIKVKELIDDAIDKASRAVKTPGTDLMPYGANIEVAGRTGPFAQGPRTTWKEYLKTYADESMPINQMEKLDDVLKSIQTGTVDNSGSMVLSAAKLNNILKNETPELLKVLNNDQMSLLRNLAADLNASQISANAGRAVGSNTLQNMAQNNLLAEALGRRIGGSSVAQTTLGRALQIPYGMANKRIQEQLGNALLNPQMAAKLLTPPKQAALARALQQMTLPAPKVVPALTSQGNS